MTRETAMKAAIMQPYFLPYIGYFQLIRNVDVFVIYDNIKYTKKGWINRNRLLQDGSDATFSLPLKKASDSLDVRDRELAQDFNRAKLLNQFKEAYRRAPEFARVFPLIEDVMSRSESNLFAFLYRSLTRTCDFLSIGTPIVVSSTLSIDHTMQSQYKVLAICRCIGADVYMNPIGGVELYSKSAFASHGVQLEFLRSRPIEYTQFGATFVPWLSIIDVLMFNSPSVIAGMLNDGYELL